MKKEKAIKSDKFTVTEVGTLLESMDQKINLIAESQVSTDRRLANVETELHGVNRRLDLVELGIDVVKSKVVRLEDGLLKLTKDLKDTRSELTENIGVIANRLTAVEARR